MGKINFNSVRNKVKNSKKIINKIDKDVIRQFEESKNSFIEDFQNHPVTQEIQSGPEATNTSNTLSGRGNLFSFIGFNRSSDPIRSIESYIRSSLKIVKSKTSVNQNKIRTNYRISYPSEQDLAKISPMPWEGGNSWIIAIERGISGFSHYMYKKFNKSRSGSGLQTEKEIRSGSYKPTKYLSSIISKFLRSVNRIK